MARVPRRHARSDWRGLYDAERKARPRVARAMARALAASGRNVDIASLASALASRDIRNVEKLLGKIDDLPEVGQAAAVLRDVRLNGGKIAARMVPERARKAGERG